MRATRGSTGPAALLLFVLALYAAVAPAAASLPRHPDLEPAAVDLGLERRPAAELAAALVQNDAWEPPATASPGAAPAAAFSLLPEHPRAGYGELFARLPRPLPPAPDPDLALSAGRSLLETRIRASRLFGPISHPCARDVSRETATGYGFSLRGSCVGSVQKGLWTDPVTGLSYARARWYDARNATWLSEDPLEDIDSPSLYAFVAWQPNMATDPLGLRCLILGLNCSQLPELYFNYSLGVARSGAQMALGLADLASGGQVTGTRMGFQAFQATEGTLGQRLAAAHVAGERGRSAVMTLGFSEAEDKVQHAQRLVGVEALQEAGTLLGTAVVEGDIDAAIEGTGKLLEGTGQVAGTAALAYGGAQAGMSAARRAVTLDFAGIEAGFSEALAAGSTRAAASAVPRTAAVAARQLPFREGETILREFQSSQGLVDLAADVTFEGRTVHLKGIAVYPRAADKLALGPREVLGLLRGPLAREMADLGFEKLRITGTRLTGAKPGKEVDLLIDLTKPR